MVNSTDSSEKTHYICQTYIEKKGALAVDKQFQYSSASEAQERAEREMRLDNCVGADAYMIVEDQSSDEVSAPTFLVRVGSVPEFDDF
jgi:hypothetical protein